MLRNFILWLFILFTHLGSFAANVSHRMLHFDHYSTTEGLVSNLVYSIKQDKDGFLWIATHFGLDRFDGKSFKHYNTSNYPALWSNEISFLSYDGNQTLTLGGANGFAMDYDKYKDRFTDRMPPELEDLNYQQIKGAYTNSRGERHLFANCGFYKEDENGIFRSVFNPLPQLKTGIIESVYQDSFGRYWLASVNELAIYSSEGKFIKMFEIDKNLGGFRSKIMPLKNGTIVVALQADELWFFNSKEHNIGAPTRKKLPFNCLSAMLTDHANQTWFATDGEGLWYTENLQATNCQFVQVCPYGDSGQEVLKIYALEEDKNGGVWIGTQNSGVWHVNTNSDYPIKFSGNNGFPKAICNAFAEDNAGNLYVASDGVGIYRIAANGETKHLQQKYKSLTGLCLNQQGELYCSTWGDGLIQINTTSGQAKPVYMAGMSNISSTLFGCNISSKGEMWVCPGNDDLYKRKPNGEWERIELGFDTLSHWPNKWILRSVEGLGNTQWILTTNTLWRIDNNQKKALIPDLANVKSHNPLTIVDGDCDPKGNFYLATNKGIICYPAQGGPADTLGFLGKANIQIVRFDKNGNLWAASENGIMSVDCANRTFKVMPGNYNGNFIKRAGYVSKNGELFFGTNSGFYKFNPNKVFKADSIGYLNFSALHIGQQMVAPGEKELQDGALMDLKELTLSHGRTNLSINVDVVDFSPFGKTKVKYRLAGLNEEWQELADDNTIDFNYLPSGEYTLEVVAEKAVDRSVRKELKLRLIVLPPWWNSWWFRMLVLAAIGTIAYFVYKRRVRSINEQRKELKAKVEEQTLTLRKLVVEKDRIISVIAHDLKSPMFGIVGALENWLGTYKDKEEEIGQNLIEKTHSSASQLQNQLSGLVDWAHAQENNIGCDSKEFSMEQLVQNVCKLQLPRANTKGIEIECELHYRHCCKSDERMTNTIVRNLMSNAIKFCNKGGKIKLKGWEENNECVFQIADNGIGMTQEQIDQFNNRHHCDSMVGTENEPGTGLGLSLCHDYATKNNGRLLLDSQKNEGTSLTLYLPLGDMETAPLAANSTATLSTDTNQDLLSGNTILVVDDDELICHNIINVLQPHAQVLTARNGKEAIELFDNNNIDIVISDVQMPELDGMELCKQIKAKEPLLPFLFISARTGEEDKLMGLSNGAIDYIPKPFSNSELQLKISNILLMRQQEQKQLLAKKMDYEEKADNVQKENEGPMNPFVEKFVAVLEENYSNNLLSVDYMAKKMAVSQSTLGRKLKSLLGKTAIDLLTEYRLNKAKMLLKEKNEDTQISDIAYKVGFSDPSYFSKKFKEYYGYSPSDIG